jgi:hypothetical protein
MKKTLFLVFLILTTFFLVSCDRDIDLDLNTPTNVTIQDGVVSWQAVSEADSYIVLVDLVEHSVTSTSFDLNTLSLAPGSYSIRVMAVKGDAQSVPSTALTYIISSGEVTSLDAPQNVRIVGGVLTWNTVLNAQGYVVYVGEQSFNVSTNTFDLGTLELEEGEYQIFVKATRGSIESSLSTVQTYLVNPGVDEGYVLLSILQAMNPMFELDMEAEDFEYEEEYRDYERFQALALTYTSAALDMQMAEEDMIGLFMHVMSMPQMMASSPNASMLFEMMDFFDDFGVQGQSLAYILFELFAQSVDQAIVDQAIWLENAEQYLADDLAYLASLQETEAFISLVTFLETNLSFEYEFVLDDLLNGPYDWDKMEFVRKFVSVFSDVYSNFEFHDAFYYEDHYNVYVQALYYMFVEMYLNNEVEALEEIAFDPHGFIQPLNEYLVRQQNVSWWEFDIINYQEQALMLENLQATLVQERELFIETLEAVIDYIHLVMSSFSIINIEMLDELVMSGDMSLQEILLLKDEIAAILLETMPTSEEMSLLFLSLTYIGEALGELEVDLKEDYANFLAEVNHAVFELGLMLIEDINMELLESVMMISEGLIIEGEYYCYMDWEYDYFLDEYVEVEVCYYMGDEVDPVKAIELVVLVGTYLEDFYLRHETQFANLEVAFGMPIFDLLVDEFIFALVSLSEDEMNQDMAMFGYIVNEVMADLETYRQAVNVLLEVGLGVLDVFFEDEGQFLIDLILFDEMRFVSEEPEVVAYVQMLLQGFLPYNEAFMMLNNLESIEAVLQLLRIPVKMASAMEVTEQLDIDLLLDELIPTIAQIVMTFANLETLFLQEAATFDWSTGIFENNFEQDNNFAIILGTILVFDQVLLQNEAELTNAIHVLFDDVLANEFVMGMLELDLLELEDFKAYILGLFDELVLGVQEIALLDFEALSEDDMILIEDFMLFLMNSFSGFFYVEEESVEEIVF